MENEKFSVFDVWFGVVFRGSDVILGGRVYG